MGNQGTSTKAKSKEKGLKNGKNETITIRGGRIELAKPRIPAKTVLPRASRSEVSD